MNITEIVLLVLGIGIFAASFIIPEKRAKLSEEDKKLGEAQIKEMLDTQMQDVRAKVSDVVDETVTYAVEKTERSMERITNEKIMAVNEYSDTVLEEIHKNHEEVVFLYDMLNDKQQTLKDTAIEVEKKAKEARKSTEEALSAAVRQAAAGQGAQKPAETAAGQGVQKAAGIVAGQTAADQSAKKEAAPLPGQEAGQPIKRTRAKKAAEAETGETKPGEAKAETANVGTTKAGMTKAAKAKRQQTLSPEAGGQGALHEVSLSFADVGANGRNNNEKILALHKEGKSNMAIARELGLGIGEVKLVIDLFKGA